ncbi:hypothetical protein, partial [Akkermansia sp.]|uniref:hypothetical protein n=1 Tax=Akkermansia sp. TaxID=1872421 RepID=UPI003AAE52BA
PLLPVIFAECAERRFLHGFPDFFQEGNRPWFRTSGSSLFFQDKRRQGIRAEVKSHVVRREKLRPIIERKAIIQGTLFPAKDQVPFIKGTNKRIYLIKAVRKDNAPFH